jgi:hypothetical protein
MQSSKIWRNDNFEWSSPGVRIGTTFISLAFKWYTALQQIVLFADDKTISYSNKCLKTLNEIMQVEINKIAE